MTTVQTEKYTAHKKVIAQIDEILMKHGIKAFEIKEDEKEGDRFVEPWFIHKRIYAIHSFDSRSLSYLKGMLKDIQKNSLWIDQTNEHLKKAGFQPLKISKEGLIMYPDHESKAHSHSVVFCMCEGEARQNKRDQFLKNLESIKKAQKLPLAKHGFHFDNYGTLLFKESDETPLSQRIEHNLREPLNISPFKSNFKSRIEALEKLFEEIKDGVVSEFDIQQGLKKDIQTLVDEFKDTHNLAERVCAKGTCESKLAVLLEIHLNILPRLLKKAKRLIDAHWSTIENLEKIKIELEQVKAGLPI